jgi:fumarate reductase subunit D
MKLRSDSRAHRHSAWWAFLMHRLSGLALALFLPLHFWALGRALQGDAAFDGFLRFADRPMFKLAEWGLVVLLALHMTGGVRLLLIEFAGWSGLRKNWIAGAAGFAALAGLAFALALFA